MRLCSKEDNTPRDTCVSLGPMTVTDYVKMTADMTMIFKLGGFSWTIWCALQILKCLSKMEREGNMKKG